MAKGLLHRRRMMQASGGILPPSGWKFAESVTLIPNYFFRTDYIPKSNTAAYFHGSINGNNTALFEVRRETGGLHDRYGIFTYNNRSYASYGTQNYTFTYTYGSDVEFLLDSNNFFVNNTLITTFNSGSFVCPVNIIFGKSRSITDGGGESNYTRNSNGITFNAASFSEDGVVMRNYMPVVSNDETLYGLFETITKQLILPTTS